MNRIGHLKRLIGLYSLTIIIAALTLLLRASPASASGNCVQDEFGAKHLVCTANDVRIAFATNPRGLDGTPITTCHSGNIFSFIADFHVTTTATARENIGLYFATAGQSSALTGTCSDNIISPVHPAKCSTTAGATPQCLGSAQYEELDLSTPTDNCGDISTSDNNQVITVEVDNVLCQAAPGSTNLALPNCTSWQQPGGTIQCVSPAPSFPWVLAAVPGSPSKCNCENGFTVPIIVQSASLSVTKTPNLSSLPDPGGPVTYTVAVNNTSNFGSVAINQICDDQYGNIATATGPACAAGKQCSAPNNVPGTTCATGITCAVPQTVAGGSSYACTFSGNIPETGLTDTVTVNGVAQNGTTPLSGTANATVTITEADSTAADIKTSASAIPTSGCATVRYNVEVDNTSGLTTDETETLSALNDTQYGDITTLQGNVLGTTCGVATGQGTLSGPGAGALPATLAVSGPSAKYTCQFDAKVCGNTSALTNPPNATNCPAGVEIIDTVSGTLVGDESEAVTQTPGKLTVDVCFSTTEATQ